MRSNLQYYRSTNLQSKSFTLTNCVVRAFGMTPFVHRFSLFMRVMISFRVPQGPG
jgi:hypothetical protein